MPAPEFAIKCVECHCAVWDKEREGVGQCWRMPPVVQMLAIPQTPKVQGAPVTLDVQFIPVRPAIKPDDGCFEGVTDLDVKGEEYEERQPAI